MSQPFVLVDDGTTMALHHACAQFAGGGQCETAAAGAFLWPGGREHQPACRRHLDWAVKVAETLGFVLDVRELPPLRSLRYIDDPEEGTAARARLLEVD